MVLSLVNNVLDKSPKRCTLDQAVELIRSDQLRPTVQAIRATYLSTLQASGSQDEARKTVKDIKAAFPAFMFTGLFNGRGDSNLMQRSGPVLTDFGQALLFAHRQPGLAPALRLTATAIPR